MNTNELNINCVISARGGSKGVSSKNIKKICGKPMIAWSIEQAMACKDINNVFVSTDSLEIKNVAEEFGAQVPFLRPESLSDDHARKWDVWVHALKEIDKNFDKTDIYVDLDCTSPLRDVADISKAIQQFISSNCDAVFSICESRKNPYFNMVELRDGSLEISKKHTTEIVRRQDCPIVYDHVASIYILSPAYLRSGNGLLSGNTSGYLIDQNKSYDVDSIDDFNLVEYLMKKKYKINK